MWKIRFISLNSQSSRWFELLGWPRPWSALIPRPKAAQDPRSVKTCKTQEAISNIRKIIETLLFAVGKIYVCEKHAAQTSNIYIYIYISASPSLSLSLYIYILYIYVFIYICTYIYIYIYTYGQRAACFVSRTIYIWYTLYTYMPALACQGPPACEE